MHHEWGTLIVIYLFLGGLSAGTLVLSSVATLAGRFPRIARAGAFAAPLPVVVGTALLVFDLGQPFYFWKLLVGFAPRSPMWLGTWLLTLFVIVSVPYAASFLPAAYRPAVGFDLSRARRRLAMASLPIGAGVGLYTGVLLSVLVARPLWNTPLLAQLFLVSALSTGAALLLIAVRRHPHEHRLLASVDVALIAIELVLLALLFLAGRTTVAAAASGVDLLVRGGTGAVFWIVVVLLGLVTPLALEIAAVRKSADGRGWMTRLEGAAPLLVLAGGLALRWVLVVAGQDSSLGAFVR